MPDNATQRAVFCTSCSCPVPFLHFLMHPLSRNVYIITFASPTIERQQIFSISSSATFTTSDSHG